MMPFLGLETMQIHTKKVKNIYTSLLNALKFIVQINFTGRCCDNCNRNFVIPSRCKNIFKGCKENVEEIPDDSGSDSDSDSKEKEEKKEEEGEPIYGCTRKISYVFTMAGGGAHWYNIGNISL